MVPKDTIVATPVLTLLHVPPAVASVSEVAKVWHTDGDDGAMAAGVGLTVTVAVAAQPAGVV